MEDDRNIRRVSYLRATKEDRIQVDSDGDDVDPAKLGAEVVDGKQQQVHSIHKILSVFSKKSDNALPSPSTESNKLEDFARADSIPDSVKEGWLEFLLNEEDSKVSIFSFESVWCAISKRLNDVIKHLKNSFLKGEWKQVGQSVLENEW